MDVDQISHIHKYDISPEIEALDQNLAAQVEETGNEGIGYKFKVNYSFQKATKGEANIVFTDKNVESLKTTTVLTKNVVSDELWPHKPTAVVAAVAAETGQNFNLHEHTLAWKKLGARPRKGVAKPADCKKDFCHFHAAHNDYTYSDKWIQLLISIVGDETEYAKLKAFKPST